MLISLNLPPKVTMPKSTEFIESKKFMEGFKLIGNKRPLTTFEEA